MHVVKDEYSNHMLRPETWNALCKVLFWMLKVCTAQATPFVFLNWVGFNTTLQQENITHHENIQVWLIFLSHSLLFGAVLERSFFKVFFSFGGGYCNSFFFTSWIMRNSVKELFGLLVWDYLLFMLIYTGWEKEGMLGWIRLLCLREKLLVGMGSKS